MPRPKRKRPPTERAISRITTREQWRNGSFETVRNFYRLLGDTNGDRQVNMTDRNRVNARIGQSGINDADVNGDGVVNSTDRNLVNSQFGRKIASGLILHD